MTDDSTADQPPDFAPGYPVYPALPQLLRVTGPALAGTVPAVYPAFVQQLLSPLTLRDREASYLTEPNQIALGAGFYDSRLIGSYAGLPLYSTTCCPLGGGSGGGAGGSSSSSPSSSKSSASR